MEPSLTLTRITMGFAGIPADMANCTRKRAKTPNAEMAPGHLTLRRHADVVTMMRQAPLLAVIQDKVSIKLGNIGYSRHEQTCRFDISSATGISLFVGVIPDT